MLTDRNILLGVTGGVAAYKAVDLASKLTGAGAHIRTIVTEAACQLVTPKSFEAVTRSPVYTTLWTPTEEFDSAHIALADWAEILVVAPATADIIAKAAAGLCDDLLSTTLCVSWAKPILFAPAMNTRMWDNPAVKRNVETLRQTGARFVGPCAGRLACGTEGIGRMAEPAEILQEIGGIAGS
jgi:phosphopantothenoylcysteine synthetase/decarboxylase